MKGNEQEMRLHKQVRQGQAALIRMSQYGNHIDGTTLLAYTWPPAAPHGFLPFRFSRQLFICIY